MLQFYPTMEGYKVIFENNRAISAHKLDYINTDKDELIKLTRKGEHRFMEWLIIYGYDENDAIEMANDIIQEYWGLILKLIIL